MVRPNPASLGLAVAVLVLFAAAGCGGGGSRRATPADQRLVYVKGATGAAARVWIADGNGAHPRLLTRGFSPVLSPDGRSVAFARAHGIYLVSSDGTRERRLTSRRLRPQAWSPDGKTLVAATATTLAVVERRTGRLRVIARGSLYGFDFAPSGDQLVYSRAPQRTAEGICGDQFDLYVVPLRGGKPVRITHDGLSAFPAWGPSRIAFSRFPPGVTIADCSAPGIWTIKPDGSGLQPVIARAPDEIASLGYYGLLPVAWLTKDELLVGVRSDAGNQAGVLDTRNRRLRRFGDYVAEPSRDGRFIVGSGGDQTISVTITRTQDGRRVFAVQDACCPDWNR